ncbi:MAG TPA: DUF5914 domain-containing protein [Kofleriaceae bacterium]|nr:DUF5914 domain-containing protein [Kofleriaceae bacterium]
MRLLTFGKRPGGAPLSPASTPDWIQCKSAWIEAALAEAMAKPGGGWMAIDASRRLKNQPLRYQVAGEQVVVWRGDGGIFAGPDTCPHMGASLADGCIDGDGVVCPWHGLRLGKDRHGAWKPYPAVDDGVLLWLRLDHHEQSTTEAPILADRPRRFIDGVIRMEATCTPEDVLANRLDPWHGVHFHPYAFRRLQVIDSSADSITVRVVYRVAGSRGRVTDRRFGIALGVEVDARFSCPDRRTIAMTIVAGEGQGSVVETHATPVTKNRTAIVEATLATSDRLGFRALSRTSGLVRPFIERAARRLWRDDAAYAERRFSLRQQRS